MTTRRLLMISWVLMTYWTVGCGGATSQEASPVDASKQVNGTQRERLTTKPSMSQICKDDTLLLSHFPIEELYGTPLPGACCAPGVLPDDYWQCKLDWPSSDVITCNRWQDMSNSLRRTLDLSPSWMTGTHQALATANRAVLNRWYETKYGCEP